MEDGALNDVTTCYSLTGWCVYAFRYGPGHADNERRRVMRREAAHADTSRIDTAQRRWLAAGNLDLEPPLGWEVCGDHLEIPAADAAEFSAHVPAPDAEPGRGPLRRLIRRLVPAIR